MKSEQRKAMYQKYREGTTKVTSQEKNKLDTVIKWMAEELKNTDNERVLDLGCSEGVFLEIFRDKFNNCQFVGVDVSKPSVEGVRKRGFEGHLCDIETQKLKLPKNDLDGVYCGDLIEHIFDLEHFLGEIRRVLKPNGWVIFTTPNMTSFSNRLRLLFGTDIMESSRNDVEHVRFFNKRSLGDILARHGFRVDKVTTTNLVIPYLARAHMIKSGLGNLGEKIIIKAHNP